jgi:hypothetical protein
MIDAIKHHPSDPILKNTARGTSIERKRERKERCSWQEQSTIR